MTSVCDNRPLEKQRAILIVDDEEGARYTLARVFEGKHRTVAAENVARARARLCVERFDIVLLDQNMPGEDGLSLLNELGHTSDSPAVIMITAYGNERLAVSAMKAGAYDYLTTRKGQINDPS